WASSHRRSTTGADALSFSASPRSRPWRFLAGCKKLRGLTRKMATTQNETTKARRPTKITKTNGLYKPMFSSCASWCFVSSWSLSNALSPVATQRINGQDDRGRVALEQFPVIQNAPDSGSTCPRTLSACRGQLDGDGLARSRCEHLGA